MKKIISILLVFVFCIGLMNPIAALADSANMPTATLEGVTEVTSGGTLKVSYYLEGTGLYGVQGYFEYDDAKLTLQSVSKAEGSPWDVEYNEANRMFLSMSFSGTEINNKTEVFVAEFTVAKLNVGETIDVSCIGMLVSLNEDEDVRISDCTYAATVTEPFETVSDFEVDTYDSSTTHVKHHILKNSSQGVVLKEGDVMTFSAEVYMKTGYNENFRLGIDIRESVKGDEADWFVYNNKVWYRKTSSDWASQTDTTLSMWQDTTYKIECIVEAYEKVTIKAYKYNSGQYDIKGTFEYEWNNVESIAQATEADGAKFTPMLLFKNVDATVSNIQLNILRNGEVTTVSGFEVDTYDSSTTHVKHHILKNSSQGVVLKEGDVMTFSAEVYMKTGYNENFRLGIDIRESVKGDEADWFVYNNQVWYRKTSSDWASQTDTTLSMWQDTTYKIECIVEAYEKVTIKAYKYNSGQYDIKGTFEYEWNNVESIAQATEADGAKFTPMLLFKNVDATVSNVTASIVNYAANRTETFVPITNAEIDTYDSSTTHVKQHLLNDSSQGVVLKEGDVMTFSADVFMKTGFNGSFRFGVDIREAVKGDEADWFVNNNAVLYRTTSSEWAKDSGTTWDVWGNTQYKIECVVEAYEKVTIRAYEYKDSQYELIKTYEYAWNDVESIDQVTEADGAKFTPMLLFKNVDAAVSNVTITVDYKLQPYVTLLENTVGSAITQKNEIANPSYQSKLLMDEWYEKATSAQKDITEVSRTEIINITDELMNAVANYKETVGTIAIGGGETNTSELTIGFAEGEMLPVNCEIEGKYIYGWSTEDVTYNSTNASEYVAEFVDTKMLEVKAQSRTNPKNSENTDIRFVSSVNKAGDYEEAGFVFSLYDREPEIGKERCMQRSTTTVYNKIYVNGELKDAQQAGYDNYSTLMYAHGFSNFTTGMKIYARAYAKIAGTDIVVYGDIVKIQVDAVNSISKGE